LTVARLQDVEQGVLPEKKEIVVTEGVTGHDVRAAVNTLMNLETKKDGKKKFKKKKNKKENHNGNVTILLLVIHAGVDFTLGNF
jgi:hypothetical protein